MARGASMDSLSVCSTFRDKSGFLWYSYLYKVSSLHKVCTFIRKANEERKVKDDCHHGYCAPRPPPGVGLTLAGHGVQKLFGWFGGPGLISLRQWFEQQGFQPAWPWVALAIVGEVGGGLSVALGFLTPLGAPRILGAIAMATFKGPWENRFLLNKRVYEH